MKIENRNSGESLLSVVLFTLFCLFIYFQERNKMFSVRQKIRVGTVGKPETKILFYFGLLIEIL